MNQTFAILFATVLVIIATLIPTYIMSRRSATSEDDWAVADRSLPTYWHTACQCNGRRHFSWASWQCLPERYRNCTLRFIGRCPAFRVHHDPGKMVTAE